MTFASPHYLLALLAIPVVAGVWLLQRHRRRRHAIRFPATAVFASVARPRPGRAVAPALLTAAAATVAVSFAKPEVTRAVPVQKASVVLITDESGSMAATDVDPTRLGAAQNAGRAFLGKAPSSLLVGFVGYSSGVEANLDPTTDHAQVTSAIDQLDADGGTATGDALSVALDELQARKGKDGKQAPAAIVLLSDGATTSGSDPLAAAQRAKQLHIPIYTVALGTQSGTLEAQGQLIPVPPDPATLQQISSISGGTAYATADADQLSAVYKSLGSKIGTRKVKQDVSANVAGLALVLLVGGLGMGVRRRSRLA